MSDETPDLGWPPLPINDTTYIDSIDVGTIKAGVIGSGKINGKEITLAGATGVIQSENFISGSSGWQIKGNGDAEFNNLTVRGDVISSNWDGVSEPTQVGADVTATQGFYLNSDEGVAQFQGIYADALEIRGNSELIGNLTLFGDMIVGPVAGGRIQMLGDSGNITNADGFLDLDPNNVSLFSFPADLALAGQNSLYSLGDSGELRVRAGSQVSLQVPAGSSRLTVQSTLIQMFTAVTMSSSLTVTGALNVDGPVDIDNTLNVLNNAIFQNTLQVVGSTVLAGCSVTSLAMGGGQITGADEIQCAAGNAGDPAYTFSTATTTGMYLNGGALAWSTAGTGRIQVGSGFFGPISDNALACGSSGNRWTAVWAVNGTIQTSDGDMKQDIQDLAGVDALATVLSMKPKSFRWKHNPARIHRGIVAQDLINGPLRDAVYQEGGEFGLNYSELIAPLIGAVQELNRRVEELEAV